MHLVAADVPLLGAVRVRVEPDLSPRGEGTSASSGRPELHRKQSAAMYVYSAPPPSSGRRRLHRRPNVSQTTALPSFASFPYPVSLLVGVPSSRRVPVRHHYPHVWLTTRALFMVPSHRSHPRLPM
jgi:hypothetical protein